MTENNNNYETSTNVSKKIELTPLTRSERLKAIAFKNILENRELEEITIKQDHLSKEYDDYFNGLTEQEQTDIRKNYENKPTTKQRFSEKPSEIGKG